MICGGQGADGGRFDAPGPRDVDGELRRHPARPAGEQHDAVGQAGRLPHVVGDEHDRGPGALPDPLELVVEDVAGHGVEGAERLVHEQHVGVLGQRPGHGHPLAHAAGQLVRALVGEAAQLDQLQQLGHPRRPAALRHALEAQGQLDVAVHREPREQRRLLEHEGAAAADVDGAGAGGVEPRGQAEQGALAAARGADEADELAGPDAEADPVEGEDAAAGRPVALRDAIEGDGPAELRGHGGHGSLT